jgi:hypothetical protein
MNDDTAILIHVVAPGDSEVARLAALDSKRLPDGPALVAEAGGEVRAALFLEDGSDVADPFFPTAHLVELLRMHASHNGHAHRSRPLIARLAHAVVAAR